MANFMVFLNSTLLIATLIAIPIKHTDGLATVNLQSAGNYTIFAQTGITTTGTTAIVGNLGVSPAAATTMTGFALTISSDGTFSTSPLVTGYIYAASYASPTPADLIQAVSDMNAAYNDASSRLNPDHLNYGAGAVTAVTLSAGLYKWTTGLIVGGTVTLAGSATDVFIFQVGGTLTFNSDANIVLSGGLLPKNIFWQADGQATLSAGSAIQGTILGKTGIVFNAGATLLGRALAQTAVTMISNSLTEA